MQADNQTATTALPAVLAVCVNWNGLQVLPAALQGLTSSTYPNLRVVVVDCASQDGSESLVSPDVTLIRLEENRGYAGAINAALLETEQFSHPGASLGRPDFFLLLNNDVEVAPDLIGELVRFASRQGPCVCGPQVVVHSTPGRLEASWGRVDWSHVLARFEDRNRPLESIADQEARKVQLLLGCALLIDSRALESTGLWDETFFMYHEEVDWLYRCQMTGVPVFYCPFVRILHHGGTGTKDAPLKKTYWLRRNTVFFLRKHRAGLGRWSIWATTLAGSLVRNLITLQWKRLGMICRGAWHGFRLARSNRS